MSEIDGLIRQAQVRAELVLGMVRLAVAALLAAAIAFAAANLPPDGRTILERQLLVAALTISAYALLGIYAIRAAWAGRLRPRGILLIATLDVLFLALNLDLSLRNTGLAANWATSLPALWLSPLALAFAALRLDPRLALWMVALLLASLALVLGCGGWILGPIPPPPEALIPFHSLPPILVRGVMLLLAGAIVVLAVARARLLLAQALEAERRRLNLTRYLPPQLARDLETGELAALRRGRRQPVAILFIDIRGFTSRAERMTPEALSRFLTAFRERLTRAVHAHGGVIDKFIGDGALVVFGVPVPAGDDARRALACARDLLEATEAWSRELVGAGEPPVAIGIGGHAGEVFVGVIGDVERLEHTVLGDVVNTAQRLEELTRREGHALLASEALLAAAGETAAAPAWQLLPSGILRGREGTVRVFAGAAMLA